MLAYTWLCSLLLVALGSPSLVAQMPHEHSARAFSSGMLLPGMGSHHHPISTRNPEAQRFFDQGLILGFGFNHDEAARSFRRAMELDPAAPMPCWGLAWALGPRYALAALTPGSEVFLDVDLQREKGAFEAVQKALQLSTKAAPNERRYIEALAQRYSAGPHANRRNLLAAYKDAMSRLTRQYPDDLDAAVLYAESLMQLRPWQLWKADGTPEPGTLEAVNVLEAVLARAAQGRYAEAKMAADKLAAVVTPTVTQMPMAEAWVAAPSFFNSAFTAGTRSWPNLHRLLRSRL